MRKFLFIIIFSAIFIVSIFAFGYSVLKEFTDFDIPSFDFSQDDKDDVDNKVYENKYYQDKELGIKLIITYKIPKLIINSDQSKSVKDIFEENDFQLGINGGYFLPDWSHAGLLEVNGEVLTRTAPADKQVTGLVLLDDDRISIEKIENVSFVNAQTVFQTGPIIINDNQVQTDYIEQAPNGPGNFIRSFIGTTDSGEVIVGVSTKFITLYDLAEYLLQNEALKDKTIDVINLDGGSSTVLYSKENSKFQVNLFKSLPYLLGF